MSSTGEKRLRKATLEDLAEMSSLIGRVIREVNAKDYPPEQIEGYLEYATTAKLRWAMQHKADYIVVCEGDHIIGVGGVNRDRGYVRQVFVAPETQGQGVGCGIMGELEAMAQRRGFGEMTLYATLTAVAFYERLGYSALKHARFQRGFETVKMSKRLKGKR